MSRRKRARTRRAKATSLDDPFAVTTSGTVLLNVQNFDGVETAEDALRRAKLERATVFIGVAMTTREVRLVLEHLHDVVNEPSGLIIGRRQRGAR